MSNNTNEKNPVVISAETAKKTRKKRTMIIPMAVSFLLAFILWFYVMSVESPMYTKTFSAVPVTVVQGNSSMSVYSGSNSTVDLTVSGKKSVLNQLSSSDFEVTADISSYTVAGRYNVPLSFTMPDGTSKSASSVDSVSLYIDVRSSKSVPVTVKFGEYKLDGGYELSESAVEKSPETVNVTGPASLLETIESAQVTVNLGDVTSSKTVNSEFTLVGADSAAVESPYISTDVKNVTVRVPVFLTRTLPLEVVYRYGFFDSSNCKVDIYPSTVTVRGEVEVINSMDAFVASTVDEKFTQPGTYTAALTAPDGVTVTDGTESATVTISLFGLSTKTVNATNIVIKNPDGETYEAAQDSVAVALRGPSDILDEVGADDVTVIVDLSAHNAYQQSFKANAEIKIADEYSSSVYELNTYTVQVTRTDG